MAITIFKTRFSFMWFERFETLLKDNWKDKVPKAPLRLLREKERYCDVFEKVRSGAEEIENGIRLQAPWIMPHGSYVQHFWRYYLGNKDYTAIKSERAWQFMVPFRAVPGSVAKLSCSKNSSKKGAYMDGFYFPHGVGVIITVINETAYSFDDMVDMASDVWNNQKFRITLPNKEEWLKIEVLKSRLLDRLRTNLLGVDANEGQINSKPFTIATIVSGEVTDPQQLSSLSAQGGLIHHGLEGLCSFSDTWRQDEPSPLDLSLSKEVKLPSDYKFLYSLENGRAVWYPLLFKKPDVKKRPHKLGCYHRNLALSSIQTMSLLAFIKLYTPYLSGSVAPPQILDDFAESAGLALGRLYGKPEDCYHSWSLSKQIDDSGLVNDINKVRKRFGQASLSRPNK